MHKLEELQGVLSLRLLSEGLPGHRDGFLEKVVTIHMGDDSNLQSALQGKG